MNKTELLKRLDAIREVAAMLPDEITLCYHGGAGFAFDGLQLHCPDESEIERIYGEKPEQHEFSDSYNKRSVVINGVSLFWLKEVEPGA